MKIALIDVNYKNSSTGKIVYDLKNYLDSKNVETHIYYGRGKKARATNVYKFGIDIETLFHAFMTRLTGLTGYFSFFSTRRLLRKLKKDSPDLVHIHELHAYFINFEPVIKYLKKKRIPIVWTFHCEFMYTGKCALTYECEKWKTQCEKCPRIRNYPKSNTFDFTKFMHKRKKKLLKDIENIHIVTPSLWMAEKVKQSFLKKYNISVINNGIDLNLFSCKPIKSNRKEYIFTSVAPKIMTEEKGGHWVLKLAESMIDYPVKFVLVGDTAETTTILKNVEIFPKIYDQKKLAEIYQDADVFLIFSKRENYPTTVIESLSCGTPVVGFKNGGAEEIIDNENGALFEQGDIESIKRFLIKYIDGEVSFNSPSTMSMSALKRFDKAIMGEKYYELYKKTMLLKTNKKSE